MAQQQQSHRLTAFYLDQSSLECKAGCGFFGNPEWLGYCSICFKQLNQHQNQQRQHEPAVHQQAVRPGSATAIGAVRYPEGARHQFFDQQYQHASDPAWWHHQQQQQQQQQHHQQPPIPAQVKSLDQQFQNLNLSQEPRYCSPIGAGDQPSSMVNRTMTRSASHMIRQVSSPTTNPSSTSAWQYPHQKPQLGPLVSAEMLQTSSPSSSLVDGDAPPPPGTNYLPFDKYEEKRRSQYTDKRSNVLKLLRRASTFKEKSPSASESPPPFPPSQSKSSNDTLNNSESTSSGSANTSTGSALLPSSLFRNLASPTSIVMSGYDTLTNLHNTILNTAKSSFSASPGLLGDNSSVHSVSQSEYMHNTSGQRGSPQQPHFLYDVAWIDCLRHTNKFARDFLTMEQQPDKSINDLSDLVHDFYQTMNDRFENQFIYKGATSDQLELLNDNMERILNEHIYQVISARIINEDEEHNMAIQRRIRSLNWITVEHLEIDIDFQHPVVHDLLDKAICQMVEMYSRTSSIDKLECIVQCSKTIFELLQVRPPSGDHHSVPVSADQFLPVLVFVVIQANPPMLPADMKYLTRFSNPRRLMSGETGYYFTNLCCALEFIEKASGASLNISEEQFNKFVSGEAVPETKSQFNTYLCDGLRTMCSNDAALKKLRRRYETRQSKIESLIEQIDVHLETNRAKLKEMQTFALSLKEKLKPNFPKFYTDLLEQNREFAIKLLPSYLRQEVEPPKNEETLIEI